VKKFKEGQEGVEDDLRSGRPSTSQIDENVSRVRNLLNSDRSNAAYYVDDFFLFSRIKDKGLKGHYFDNVESIQAAVTTLISEVPVEAFQGVTGHGRVDGKSV